MSRRLSDRGIDHVVLERGDIAENWRTKRWPGLRLLTPNWMLGLPGRRPDDLDPNGFLTAAETASFITDYADLIDAPIRARTAVTSLRRGRGGFDVVTDGESVHARAVVLATGPGTVPRVPKIAAAIPPRVCQCTAPEYRGPDALPEGGVLVVGASATGVQLARELRSAGRHVTLAVGEHVRLPRRYRDRDIFWWLHSTGVLAEGIDDIDDISRARRLPSPQLAGSATPVDLTALVALGVRLVGRLTTVDGGIARFSGSLRNMCALADLKMQRFLDRADAWASANGLDDSLPPPERPDRTPVPDRPRLELDLRTNEIGTVLWATGFRPDYSWLDLPVLDRTGRLRHRAGRLDVPGVYALGLPVMRSRASSYIFGASDDTQSVAEHLCATLTAR